MTDKQINRWLRRHFSAVGWVLVLYYGLMTLTTSITAVTDMAAQLLESGGILLDWEKINGNAWGYIAALLVGFAILDAWKGSRFWRQEVFAKENSMRVGVFLTLLCFCMGAQMANTLWITLLEAIMNSVGKSVMPVLEAVAGDTDTFSMFLYASILAPVWEEILFRGYVLRTLRLFGKRFAILSSAILFGLFHGNLLQTPYALLMGLVLGYVTVEYSISWAIALHMFNNLVLADLLTRLTANWSEMAYGTLNLILFGGSAVISVLILLRNRWKLRAYRGSEWIDRRCLKCFFTSSGILALTALACVNMILVLLA
ncbi:MAG: type II CAAX endopeptidase family protein [Oscillospiraceae bacterium]